MFHKNFLDLCRQGWLFGVLLLLLSACNTSSGPLRITDISVHPDPVIGQTATLHVEVMSTKDEPDITIWIELPPGVKLMSGNLMWEGSLSANQPQSHEVDICVLYEGDWRLDIGAYSILSTTSSYEDSEVLHIINSGDGVRVAYGADYHFTQPPGGMPLSYTPLPETPPKDICP